MTNARRTHVSNPFARHCSAAGLLLLALAPAAGSRAQVPFDTAAASSEQLRYNGESTQIVAAAAGDSLTVAWQLYQSGKPISTKITSFRRSGGGLSRAWDKQLPLPRLAGFTSDGANYYVLSAASEDLRRDATAITYRPNVLMLTKLDGQGNQLWQRDLNAAAYLGEARNGVAATAIFSPLTGGTGALSYGNGKVVVALATNTLIDANINERHQRAQYFVVGADGAGFGAASETSWRHSFDQRLLFDGQDFVFMDLADAGWYMPGAGIALRKIKPTPSGADFIGDLQGVYAYVRQGESAGGQNFSFTSLGDLERGARGYVALFTSEKSNPGGIRNGWQVPVAEPRNLGLVHVTKGFEAVREGEWNSPDKRLGNTIIRDSVPVAINVTRSVVDSSGPSGTYVRPDKPEKTFTQTGVVWLTNLPAGVSAERPKLVRVADDRYIALWEEWSYSGTQLRHRATKSMLVGELGQVIRGETTVNARLNPSGADRPFVMDGKAAWVAGDAGGGKFIVHAVDVNLALTTSETSTSGSASQPPATVVSDRLLANGTLRPGDKIQSANGQYILTYQTDGNLVIYAGTRALWASGTNGRSVGRAIMQTDGNLVIYGASNEFIWNTGTVSPGSRLIMQDDGNLVIYRADGGFVWASNTAR